MVPVCIARASLMLRNAQVHSVLEKLQPDMIALDAQFVGKVDRAPSEVIAGNCAIRSRPQSSNTLL